MSREKDRTCSKAFWKIIRRIVMSVRREKDRFSTHKINVVGHYRKFKNHLVNFGVAIAAHLKNIAGLGIQQRNYFPGVIVLRQIVAGP